MRALSIQNKAEYYSEVFWDSSILVIKFVWSFSSQKEPEYRLVRTIVSFRYSKGAQVLPVENGWGSVLETKTAILSQDYWGLQLLDWTQYYFAGPFGISSI